MSRQKKNNSVSIPPLVKEADPYIDLLPSEEEIFEKEVGAPRLHDIDGLTHHSSTYTPTQKLQAVTYYAVLGNLFEVSKRLNINYNTLRQWKNYSPWWGEAMDRIRAQRNDKLDAKLSNQMELLLNELEDRISHGDEVILRDGSTARQKMKGKEIAVTYAVLHDKRALLRGDATSNPGGNKTQGEILMQLKESFEDLSETLTRKVNEKVINPED